MKRIFLTAFTLVIMHGVFGQNVLSASTRRQIIDSLKKELAASQPDSNRIEILIGLFYSDTGFATLKNYLQQALELAEKIDHKRLQSRTLRALGLLHQYSEKRPAEALAFFLKALDISERINNTDETGKNNRNIGRLYNEQKDYAKARYYLFRGKELLEQVHNDEDLCITLSEIGKMFSSVERYDSALLFYDQAYKIAVKENQSIAISSLMWTGDVYANQGDYATAMRYLRQSLARAEAIHQFDLYNDVYLSMAKIFQKTGQDDSTLFYARQSFDLSVEQNFIKGKVNAGKFLFEYYDGKNDNEAYKYLKIITRLSDSLNPVERAREIQNLAFGEDQRRQSLEAAREESRKSMLLYVVLSVLFSLLVIALILFRNNRHKQKANELLEKQKQEINEQRTLAEQALKELQTTQTQLVQSEKMASLGELTAGIAHEIQNPLNFVNNFSEVSVELLDELKDGPLKKLTEVDKAESDEIVNSLTDNLQKINHHGKRADAIVKGMLQHSRTSSGKKEPTDINALADEYLRLSYHGLRAKEKSFNADFKTDFDESIDKIEVMPQDFGRVLLNLYNNAFYSVNDKKKLLDETYKPLVSVSTKKINNIVEVVVKDNGTGIPQKVLDKIYQPFFTTKPTGQGTGLGLSLSYDIIKAHNGELEVETKEGEFAEFIIKLPQ